MQCMNDEGASHLVFSICFARRAVAAFWVDNSRFMCVVCRFSYLRLDWKYAQWRLKAGGKRHIWSTFRSIRHFCDLILSSLLLCFLNLFPWYFLISRFSHSFAVLFRSPARLSSCYLALRDHPPTPRSTETLRGASLLISASLIFSHFSAAFRDSFFRLEEEIHDCTNDISSALVWRETKEMLVGVFEILNRGICSGL